MLSNILSNVNIHVNYGALTTCDDAWRAEKIVCNFHKLYYVIKGNCVIEIDGKKHLGERGTLFFIPAGTKHSYYQENDNYVTKHWVHFTFEANAKDPFKGLELPISVTVDHPKIMEKNFKIAYGKAETTWETLLQQAKIMEILSEFLRLAGCEEENAADPLQKVVDYLGTHTAENLTVEKLAEIMHLHPNYFIRAFKQQTGMPPIKYLTLLKMERAKSLLERSNLPIGDISASLGYKDPAHFTKVFKANCGYSPRSFREKFSEKSEV